MNNNKLLHAIMEISETISETELFQKNKELAMNMERIKESCINCIDIINNIDAKNTERLFKRFVCIDSADSYAMFCMEIVKRKQYEGLFAIKNKNGYIATEVLDNPFSLALIRYPAIFSTRKFAKKYLKEKNADENEYEIIEYHPVGKKTTFILCEYI